MVGISELCGQVSLSVMCVIEVGTRRDMGIKCMLWSRFNVLETVPTQGSYLGQIFNNSLLEIVGTISHTHYLMTACMHVWLLEHPTRQLCSAQQYPLCCRLQAAIPIVLQYYAVKRNDDGF